jgi:hypothetical protein
VVVDVGTGKSSRERPEPCVDCRGANLDTQLQTPLPAADLLRDAKLATVSAMGVSRVTKFGTR